MELTTHLGILRARVPGPITLEITVPDGGRVRISVTVDVGGSATLTGAAAASTTGPTAAAVTLENTGPVRLTGTGIAVLGVSVEEPFEAVPAIGWLRLARAVLPPATHLVDVMAYADVDLAGHTITWTDALDPTNAGPYHVFAAGSRIADGRTARVYGGTTAPPADGGVDLYAGGTAGALPTTGVIFRLHAPDGTLLHELCALPDAAFRSGPALSVYADADRTRAFLVGATPLPPGSGRVRLRWLRDAGPDLPRLSVGGVADVEDATLRYRLR